MKKRLVAVDLFSGCGGLSLGLTKAGFHVAAAVENNPQAAKVYRRNHPQSSLLEQDIGNVTAARLRSATGKKKITLLAGCAPCQGFCALTRKPRNQDARNLLLLDMLRLVRAVRPKAVLMENVPGILTRGRHVFKIFLSGLRKAGYHCTYKVVQMTDYGVPQYRRRLVFLAGSGFSISPPAPTHSRKPPDHSRTDRWVTVREAIGHLRAPVTLRKALTNGGPQSHGWHVTRDLQPQTKKRLRAATPGKTWVGVPEVIRPTCHRGYTGFTNTYGRMAWDEPSPTITAGCTTSCKGRFGHPDRRRYTISVREAALLQSFPMKYEFPVDRIDSVCELIGNAVPPLFARIVGRQIRKALQSQNGVLARKR